jgi:cell division protein ZapB
MNPIDKPHELKTLEDKLDLLIGQYRAVQSENHELKIQQEALKQEKLRLLEKTALARNRVEAMISRLKALEHNL